MPRPSTSRSTDKHDLDVARRAVYAARELARFGAVVRENDCGDLPIDRATGEISGFSKWLDRNLSDDEDREALVPHAAGSLTSELRKIRVYLIDPTTSDPLPLIRLAVAAGLSRERFLNLLLTDHRRGHAAGHLEALDGAVTHVFGECGIDGRRSSRRLRDPLWELSTTRTVRAKLRTFHRLTPRLTP